MKGPTFLASSAEQPRTGTAIRSSRIVAKRERIRESLVRTGLAAFAEKGMSDVSVEEILEDVGISRRTFYSYFANKYEIVAAAMNAALTEGIGHLTAWRKKSDTDALTGIVDCYLSLWDHHRQALTVIAETDDGIMPYIQDNHVGFYQSILRVLEMAARSGALRNGDPTRTLQVISRTAVPLLKIYDDHPNGPTLFRESMLALLGHSKG